MLSSKNTAFVVTQRDLISFDYTRRKMPPSTNTRTQDQRHRSHKYDSGSFIKKSPIVWNLIKHLAA